MQAQYIWWANLICFFVHFSMVIVTFHLAYGRRGLSPFRSGDSDHLMISIYRITSIPTPEMIGANETAWVTGNFTTEDIRGAFYVRDNHEPVNMAFLVAAWFGLSAAFHLLAVIMGMFEWFWFWYWRQMDDAFCWWRWAEYSVSGSLMAMTIGIVLGQREQTALAGLFMLHWSTMAFGFLTEYIAMPKSGVDTNTYAYPVGAYQWKLWKGSATVPGQRTFKTDYYRDMRALKIISQVCTPSPFQNYTF